MDKIITNEPYEIIRLTAKNRRFAFIKASRNSASKEWETFVSMWNEKEARDIAESILEELK